MARPELNTSLAEPKPYHDQDIQWAIRFDRANFADAILAKIGSDHSTDQYPLWEAEWSADSVSKNVFLRREVFNGDEDIDMYWLGVSEYDEKQAIWYGFTREFACISWMPNEEVDSEDIAPEDDLALWRQLVGEVDMYLDTAPVRRVTIEPDNYWDELFDEIILSLHADDPIVKDYIQQVESGVEYNPKALSDMIGRLCVKRRIEEPEAREVVMRAVEWTIKGIYGH